MSSFVRAATSRSCPRFFLCLGLLGAILTGCVRTPTRLSTRNWAPQNADVLGWWLDDLASRDPDKPKVAVFDFDNTCIFSDVGETFFRFQLANLDVRLTPAELGAILPAQFRGVKQLADPEGDVSFVDARADILTAYGPVWAALQAGGREKALALPQAHEFRALMYWYFIRAYETEGVGAPFAFRLLAKFSRATRRRTFVA